MHYPERVRFDVANLEGMHERPATEVENFCLFITKSEDQA
jgi:hypothetical protein